MQATSAEQLVKRIQQLEVSLDIKTKKNKNLTEEDLLEGQSKSPCLFRRSI